MTGTGRVLVACPTYAGKEYALDAWAAGFRAMRDAHPEPVYAYQVDNTNRALDPDLRYLARLTAAGIDASHLDPWNDWDRTFRRCWEAILDRARDLDCYWVLSMEADNVVAPEGLGIMVGIALAGACHLVTHSYPMHRSAAEASGADPEQFYYNELGCALMTRSLLARALEEWDEFGQMVVAIWAVNDRYMGGHAKLTRRFAVQHLDGYEMAVPNLGPSEIPGLVYPVPAMPADTGTVLPPALRAAS